MAHNLLLTFNGVTPATGVLGVTPSDYFEIDNGNVDDTAGDPHVAHDRAVAVRIIAKAAALQTVAEARLARANARLRWCQHGGHRRRARSRECFSQYS